MRQLVAWEPPFPEEYHRYRDATYQEEENIFQKVKWEYKVFFSEVLF